ncbi:MAG: Hsp20/alpha crystallin family protein [Victivallaceae bacterium]|jgi:HSP20 family protein
MIKDLLPWHKKNSFPVEVRKDNDVIGEFQKQMNKLFANFFDDESFLFPSLGSQSSFVPRFEISESDKGIDITAELPGVEEKDIDVSIDGNVLNIKGEKRVEHDEDNETCRISERSYGSFQRSFSLPDGLDVEKIDAKFKNGILKMFLPKTEESRKNVKKIKING